MTGFELVAIRIPKLVAGVLLLAGMTVNFANVVGRYFFQTPLFWAEEAMIYLSVWSIFIAMIAVTASRAHLSMDLLVSGMPPLVRRFLEISAIIAGSTAMGFLSLQSFETIRKLSAFGVKTISLQIPMAIPHISVLMGFGISAVVILFTFRWNGK